MVDYPRIITGLIFLLLGFFLIFLTISSNQNYGSMIIGAFCLIIGIVILLNKKENKIEEVKKR